MLRSVGPDILGEDFPTTCHWGSAIDYLREHSGLFIDLNLKVKGGTGLGETPGSFTLYFQALSIFVCWKAPCNLRVYLGASFGPVDGIVHRVKLQLFQNKTPKKA